MFTIKAEDLAVILDQAAPHRFRTEDPFDPDALILDCAPSYLHVVGCSARTFAIARTSVEEGDVWTAPVEYEDAAALRGWLESSHTVTVEHVTADGHQLLRFTEGVAQLTVPAAPHVGRCMPWRVLMRLMLDARQHPLAQGRPVQFNTEDLSLWSSAGVNGEAIEFRSLGPLGTLVTAGPDFLGLQTPHGWDGPEPGEGWASSLRARQFPFAGQFLEVGARYVDAMGTAWIVPAKPGPGEEPHLISADFAAVALPISQVLAVGKYLIRVHA
ncbi:hypothetical protein ABZ078_31645 [Streptomyces sp. NPDC006385]|uniref:hypothetical protein n=1 Tax=Streptomyces sp. NPDC006385 TaxID=3156761 RepID=UPI0033AD36CD